MGLVRQRVPCHDSYHVSATAMIHAPIHVAIHSYSCGFPDSVLSACPWMQAPVWACAGSTYTDSAATSPLSEVSRGSRAQSSSHLTALKQCKTQVCTSSGIDTPGNSSSMDVCMCMQKQFRRDHVMLSDLLRVRLIQSREAWRAKGAELGEYCLSFIILHRSNG